MSSQPVSPEEVRVSLENHLPPSLPPAGSMAIFCVGHCFGVHERVAGLRLVAGGVSHAPAAMRMPRPDLLQWLGGTAQDPNRHSYRSGFWATIPVQAPAAGAVELSAWVRLESGRALELKLGEIPIRPAPPPGSEPASVPAGAIAVCMGTFDPDPELVRAQIDSLRAQTDERWLCLISDGGSSPERVEHLERLVRSDNRFVVSRSEQRLGHYENFERALRMVPEDIELIALCDQDDRWYPQKLAVLREALGSAELVYSDLRWVSPDGRVLRDSLWRGRRNEYRNLASLLVANTVPGASMLFPRRLLDRALPFPDPPGDRYHDHWLALVALASGDLRYVNRPLYDWVQHSAAASSGAEREPESLGSRGWRGAYFGGYVMREVQARTLLLRCGPAATTRKRRALELFLSAADSPIGFLWLLLRPMRRLVGRGETLGGEWPLACGIAWRWLIALLSWRADRPGKRAHDASYPNPPRFEQRRLRRWRSGL